MKNTYLTIISFLSIVAVASTAGVLIRGHQDPSLYSKAIAETRSAVEEIQEPIYKYGLNLNDYTVIDQKVE
ncbi:MAG: hypothetical protein JST83_09260, partial [Bacteroidetes bacterium]|nr:hypothetical protein [Bacteroidota bacterium]